MTRGTDNGEGGRVTSRDLMAAVQGVYGRVDEAHERLDAVVAEQARTNLRLVGVEGKLTALRGAVNERLHEVEDEVGLLKRPWQIVGAAAQVVSRRLWLFAGVAVLALAVENLTVWLFGWPW